MAHNLSDTDAPFTGPEFSLADLTRLLSRHRFVVMLAPVLMVAIAITRTLLQPRVFAAQAAFLPQSSDASRNRLSGIAAQFGLAIPSGGETGRSPAFYVELLHAHELLRAGVLSDYELPRGHGTLLDFFETGPATSPLAVEKAIELLRAAIGVNATRETGMVRATVTTTSASVSNQVAKRLLALVDEFNLRSRQFQASAERQFIQQRMDTALRELHQSEERLLAFEQQNLEFGRAPRLASERERLRRETDMRQQVVTSLFQSYEQARIDEVRNTPAIVVVEEPYPPVRPAPRRLAEKGVIALVGGLAIGVVLAFALERLAWSRGTNRIRERSSAAAPLEPASVAPRI
jgi:uncharacterized protein involved in exopolysaccharide biosynthesis